MMSDDTEQKQPTKGELGGICGHETCRCQKAYWADQFVGEDGALKTVYYCQGCANDVGLKVRYHGPCVDRSPPAATAQPTLKSTHHYELDLGLCCTAGPPLQGRALGDSRLDNFAKVADLHAVTVDLNTLNRMTLADIARMCGDAWAIRSGVRNQWV